MHTPLGIAFRRPWPGTRRGLKLWLLSVIIGMKGAGYLFSGSTPSNESALRLITERADIGLHVCGAIILGPCIFSLFCSYCHYGRDRYGYMALTGFAFAWAAAYAVSPLLLDGPSYAWQGTLSWSLFGVFLLIAASDPEPRQGSLL